MKKRAAGFHVRKLNRAGACLAEFLEESEKPVLTRLEFFGMIRRMYRESPERGLGLRSHAPGARDYVRFRAALKKAGVIGNDRDYGARVIRALSVPDLPAEGIVSLVDPDCYVSHLSAMQYWGFTDRAPRSLLLTCPDRGTAAARMRARAEKFLGERVPPFPLTLIEHPAFVRRRPIHVTRSGEAGACLRNRSHDYGFTLATPGQTFLDMLRKPRLCGGMAHVLDVWEEHAVVYLEDIVAAVERTSSGIVKTRAGYILEEFLGLRGPEIERWKERARRGGSRKLDPDQDYEPTFSSTWELSLNV